MTIHDRFIAPTQKWSCGIWNSWPHSTAPFLRSGSEAMKPWSDCEWPGEDCCTREALPSLDIR